MLIGTEAEVSVTRAAVYMGVKEMACEQGHRGAYNWPLILDENRYDRTTAEQSRIISMQ